MIHLEKLTYENFDDVFELKVLSSGGLCLLFMIQKKSAFGFSAHRRMISRHLFSRCFFHSGNKKGSSQAVSL